MDPGPLDMRRAAADAGASSSSSSVDASGSKAKRRRREEDETEAVAVIRTSSSQVNLELCEMWRAEQLCDIEVVVGDVVFKAHRVVLAAGSATLRAQFLSSMRDADTGTITISEVPPTAFRAVLETIYSGECRVTPSSLEAVLSAASRLEVASLLSAAAAFLQAELSPENVIDTWRLAVSLARPVEFDPLTTAW